MEKIELETKYDGNYPEKFNRGDCFYIKNIPQFRGSHFVTITIQPELIDSDGCRVQLAELEVVDTAMNTYVFRDMGDSWMVTEHDGSISIDVPKDDVVIKD